MYSLPVSVVAWRAMPSTSIGAIWTAGDETDAGETSGVLTGMGGAGDSWAGGMEAEAEAVAVVEVVVEVVEAGLIWRFCRHFVRLSSTVLDRSALREDFAHTLEELSRNSVRVGRVWDLAFP